jgi:circadian clock protein KaiB
VKPAPKSSRSATAAAAAAAAGAGAGVSPASAARYMLRLYVTGTRRRSLLALENIKRICEQHLRDCYELEVIDLYQQPALAAREQIIVSPTLVKRLPLPPRRVIGDMSDTRRVLGGLEVDSADRPKDPNRSTTNRPPHGGKVP